MAYSISYWYDKIITEKNNQPTIKDAFSPNSSTADNLTLLLADLSSGSKVGIWRLFSFIIASVNWMLGVQWDLFQAQVQAIANTANLGTDSWWYGKALGFQYGFSVQDLIDSNGNHYMGYTDTTSTAAVAARIITIAAIAKQGNASILKVAKTVGGVTQQLSSLEFNSFSSYCSQIQPVGVNVSPKSFPADLVKYQLFILYDGQFAKSDVDTSVQAAINAYHNNLVFDGTLYLSLLGDAIQNATVNGNKCVIDFQIIDAQAKSASGVYVEISRSYPTVAGYCIVDPSFPLYSSITYQAQ